MVRPEQRIRRHADFQDVYKRGIRIPGRYATLFCLARSDELGRLGVAATRKLGGAVERNRAKRLIREVFRRTNLARGFDVVVVPRRELLDASLTAVESDYRTAIERFLRRARRADAAPSV